MENLGRASSEAGTAMYPSGIQQLWQYMERDSGRVCKAKRRMKVDVGITVIGALLNLDSAKKESRIPNSVQRFLITRRYCLRERCHSDFAFASGW